MDFLRALIDPGFMPHGHCYLWRPEMVWLQVVSNLIIGLSYLSISLTLLALTRRLRGIPFSKAYLAFGLFIVSCGFTHLMDVVTVWRGAYWVDGAIRAFTALASAATAVWLFPLFPQVVRFGEIVRAEQEESRAALHDELARSHSLQRAVAAKEQQFRELIDNLPELAWSAAPDGAIEFYNRPWYEYTGTTFEEMKGWGWKSVQHPSMLDAVTERWQRSLATQEAFEMEFPIRRANGEYRWFLTRVRPLRDEDGKVVRWIGTNTDIDDQRRARAALKESVQQRDEFLSIAAHELRTPLTALSLQIELAQRALAQGGDGAVMGKRLGAAAGQTQRMTALIEELLDLSRITAGRFAIERGEVDLAALVRDAVAARAHQAEAVGSPITVTAPDACVGRFDATRLEQVLTNLLENAIKYGNKKPIAVTVTAAERVTIEIADQGLGIAAEDRERIFERFERGVSSRNYGGLGLGLFITREIVLAHRGTIEVTSQLGAGSVFRVTLPWT
jgi:PAS domain S-box-containing protein